jgi:hypothetical protein
MLSTSKAWCFYLPSNNYSKLHALRLPPVSSTLPLTSAVVTVPIVTDQLDHTVKCYVCATISKEVLDMGHGSGCLKDYFPRREQPCNLLRKLHVLEEKEAPDNIQMV